MSILTVVVALTTLAATPAGAPNYEFTNGLWFDGQSFARRIVYTVAGRLTFRKPRAVERTIDLKGWYVVPPFAEAHNHNLIS